MTDDADRVARGVQLKRRNLRDSLAFLLDSTVDMPAGYDRDTLLMRLEALIREQRALERERCAKVAEDDARKTREAGGSAWAEACALDIAAAIRRPKPGEKEGE